MIGSIIGDIVGSIYEFNNIRTKDFDFFGKGVEYTDDSILTFATADAILANNLSQITDYYARYAKAYPSPMGGYGVSFKNWVVQKTRTGYTDLQQLWEWVGHASRPRWVGIQHSERDNECSTHLSRRHS